MSFHIKRLTIAVFAASVLFSVCQADNDLAASQGTIYQDFSKPVAIPASEPLLGEPPTLSDGWLPQYAERVPSSNTGGWSIDTANRQLTRAFYNSVYTASLNTPIEWTGGQDYCDPGETSSAFKDSVLARINYFRAMAGVPANIALSDTYNAKAQQAALMFSVNNSLSHNPSSSWDCYTSDGADAAASSNIYLGRNGWDAVSGFMVDVGSNNTPVGHRRWLLFPQTQLMGTGDVPAVGNYSEGNAIWVMDGNSGASRPATRDDFVAWPTKGINPYQVVPARWSFSYPDADFSSASITMTTGGTSVSVSKETLANGYGENTLVWRPYNYASNQVWPKPTSDTIYQVSITNVKINGTNRNFNYAVTVIDPKTAGAAEESAEITGTTSPVAGFPATYGFTAMSMAQEYEVYVAEITAASAIYNAEAGSPGVTDGTDSSYTLVYADSSSNNGTNVYRLAPATESETVAFPATFIPSSTSVLTFDSMLGYAKGTQTAALQISVDDGANWQDIYAITGTDASNGEESSFSRKEVPLAAYADKMVKLRAEYRYTNDGSHYVGSSASVSFLLDNVKVSDVQQAVNAELKNTGSETSVTFTPASGKKYALAARAVPWVGYPGMDWGALFYVEAADDVADSTPDAFSFNDQTSVALSSDIISDAFTVSGINAATSISVSGGEYSINGGTFTSAAGTVASGATVRVRHTSSADYSAQTITMLNIGGVSGAFSSTTLTKSQVTLNVNGTGSSTTGEGSDNFTVKINGGGGSMPVWVLAALGYMLLRKRLGDK